MSKSIYGKALDILVDSVTDPQDEDNNCYILNYKEINLIIDTVKEAQKQEELLELYKRKLSIISRFPNPYPGGIIYKKLLETTNQIKELEK